MIDKLNLLMTHYQNIKHKMCKFSIIDDVQLQWKNKLKKVIRLIKKIMLYKVMNSVIHNLSLDSFYIHFF
jgi:DNA polymerase III alpha subunit (gram-positive type)